MGSTPQTAHVNEFDFWKYNSEVVPQAVITCKAEFNSELYFGMGQHLIKLNGTGNGFTHVKHVGVHASTEGTTYDITDLETFTDSKLYIAFGFTYPYQYMDTTPTFTESTEAVKTFQYFCTVHSATPVLWGNNSVNTIYSNTNPVNGGAGWGSLTTVGSSFYSILNLHSFVGALYIRKQDMPYYLNSVGAVKNDLAPELAVDYDTTNICSMFDWQNKLYISAGAQTLLEYDSGTNTYINPSKYCTNLSSFVGWVQGIAADSEYLFAVIDNSTEIEVLAGRWETIDSTTSWVWHPIHELTLTGCRIAFVSPVFQKRLWITSTLSTANVYYIPLPVGYGNITADANRSFKTLSYFYTPYYHGNFPLLNKAFIKITAILGHTYDANIYWECWYQTRDGSLTDAGDLIGTASSRIATLYFPANTTSTMIRLKFIAKTNDVQKTPILLGYNVQSILYTDRRSIISCTVRAENEVATKSGMTDKGMASLIATTLENARNASWPVTLYDIEGNTQYVKLLPLPSNIPQWTLVKDEKGRVKEKWYNLQMQVVELS